MTAADTLLDASIGVAREQFSLEVDLAIGAGEVVALLGPNGAGKTTTVRALAGLQPLSSGHIRLNQSTIDCPAQRQWLPAERRNIGVVFQDYLLFPHLTVVDNIAFGLRRRNIKRAAARATAQQWLEHVDLAEYAHRKPRQLSGGQAQRVALARALAIRPDLLLLDEPLAALDAGTRLDTRAVLHHHLRDHPGATLLVTHDPLDAIALADTLVIIESGRVAQVGDATTITARPRTDYVAQLVGLNLYNGHADGNTITIADGFSLTAADKCYGDAFVAFPPSAVALHAQQPEGSPRNTFPASITGMQRHGDNLRISLRGDIVVTADVTPAAVASLQLQAGQQVWAAIKAAETRAYPA